MHTVFVLLFIYAKVPKLLCISIRFGIQCGAELLESGILFSSSALHAAHRLLLRFLAVWCAACQFALHEAGQSLSTVGSAPP